MHFMKLLKRMQKIYIIETKGGSEKTKIYFV